MSCLQLKAVQKPAVKIFGTNLAADTTYTLKVDLLNDWGYSHNALGYCIALHAGSYQPSLLYGTKQFTSSDAKMELTLTITTGDSPSGLNTPLWIELTQLTSGQNIPYDNVRLDGTGLGKLTLSATAGTLNLLKGGSTSITATVGNQAGTGADNINWSVNNHSTPGLTISQSSSTGLVQGTTTQVSGTYAGSNYGTSSVTVGATGTNATLGTAAIGSPATSSAVSINVGNATASKANVNTTFGTALTAAVGATADAYVGLESTVNAADIGGGAAMVGSVAKLLYGTPSVEKTVSMAWRTRTITEASNPHLISDVVNLTGMGPGGGEGQTDTFVLQMSYNPALLTGGEADMAAAGEIYLATFDIGTQTWKNAILGNHGDNSGGTANVQGAWNSTDDTLGTWGVDTVNNVVWAVVNHNSEFAVVPEPGTLALLAAGLLGLLAYAWRKRK